MPRRPSPDPYAATIGRRIRQLRQEAGITMEKLAYESDLGSKGHLSSIERGLVVVTVKTLRTIADGLGVHPADLLASPEDGPREAVLEASRHVAPEMLARWVREAGARPSGSARAKSRRA